MQKQLVIFDFDGTLINSVPDLAQALNLMIKELHCPQIEISQIESWIGNGMPKLVGRALAFIGADVKTNKGLQSQAESMFMSHYQKCYCDKTYLYPNAEFTLSELKKQGKVLALATNKPRQFVKPILEGLNIEQYFSFSLGGDDVVNKKPHAEMLLQCMKAFSVSPNETLMVGDSENDIHAARNAGIEVAAVTHGYNHGQPVSDSNPDFLLDSLEELLTCGALETNNA